MRPQRFSCGIDAGRYSSRARYWRFNEAAAFQLRNPASAGVGRSRSMLQ